MNQYLVYFIQCNNYVKIGQTIFLPRRLQSLNMDNPYTLSPLGVILCHTKKELNDTERGLHHLFKPYHHKGEWFTLNDTIKDYITKHCSDATPYLQHTPHDKKWKDPSYRKRRNTQVKERYRTDPHRREAVKKRNKEATKNGYYKEYHQRPKVKEKMRQRSQTPEYKAYQRQYQHQYREKKKRVAKHNPNQLELF